MSIQNPRAAKFGWCAGWGRLHHGKCPAAFIGSAGKLVKCACECHGSAA